MVHKCLDTAKLELNNDMEHQRLDLAEKSVHRPGRAELVGARHLGPAQKSEVALDRFLSFSSSAAGHQGTTIPHVKQKDTN
jgi:hypothetical protein